MNIQRDSNGKGFGVFFTNTDFSALRDLADFAQLFEQEEIERKFSPEGRQIGDSRAAEVLWASEKILDAAERIKDIEELIEKEIYVEDKSC